MSERKRGAISDYEKKFLKENYKTLTPEEIASQLDRTVETVKNWYRIVLRIDPDERLTSEEVEKLGLEKEIIKSPEWEALKEEFTIKELNFFKHRYAKLMAQFRQGTVYATEETQIFMLIKYEIMMQRNLKETNKSYDESSRLEKMLQDTYDSCGDVSSMDDSTKSFVLNLENQLAAMRAARQAKSTEYNNFTTKHSALLKDLKGTRDQRITKLEGAAGSVLELFKQLQLEEVQKQKGRHMELAKYATEKQVEKLSQLHTYSDESIDQPLLTPENVYAEEGDINAVRS